MFPSNTGGFANGNGHPPQHVWRLKQFALYIIPNKLLSRELLSTKNISSRERWAKDLKFFISRRLNNVGRLANDEKFWFKTFSYTSQYAALYALNMTSSLLSFFSWTFFLKWNLETCPCISDSMGSLCSWIVLLNCSQGVALKFSDACIRSKTFLFLDPISCKCLGSCGTTSCAQICPI